MYVHNSDTSVPVCAAYNSGTPVPECMYTTLIRLDLYVLLIALVRLYLYVYCLQP
jgi:hypothetical protein